MCVFVCECRRARRLPLKDSFIVVVSFIQAGHRVKDALKGKKEKAGASGCVCVGGVVN